MRAPARVWLPLAVARGLGLGLGVFLALGELRLSLGGGRDGWPLPRACDGHPVASIAVVACGLLLIAFAFRPRAGGLRAACTGLGLGLLSLGASLPREAGLDGYWLHPLPLYPVALGIGAGLLAARCTAPSPARAWLFVFATTLAAGLAWPLFLMGARRDQPRADVPAVVVLGARVYANGEPSLALADRARSAAQAARGLDRVLVVSGGPGDGATHEAEAMATLAREVGVSPDRIVQDRNGVSTLHTARNLAALYAERGWGAQPGAAPPRALAVSHGYHLPRVAQALSDEGLYAATLAARQTRPLARRHVFRAREVLAYWAYWARGLLPQDR